MKCPCHTCNEREGPCSDSCERYRAWKEQETAKREYLRNHAKLENAIGELHYNGVKRARRGL